MHLNLNLMMEEKVEKHRVSKRQLGSRVGLQRKMMSSSCLVIKICTKKLVGLDALFSNSFVRK